MVAVIQFAITLGAGLGGMLFDGWGYQTTFFASGALLIASSLIAVVGASQSVRPPHPIVMQS